LAGAAFAQDQHGRSADRHVLGGGHRVPHRRGERDQRRRPSRRRRVPQRRQGRAGSRGGLHPPPSAVAWGRSLAAVSLLRGSADAGFLDSDFASDLSSGLPPSAFASASDRPASSSLPSLAPFPCLASFTPLNRARALVIAAFASFSPARVA